VSGRVPPLWRCSGRSQHVIIGGRFRDGPRRKQRAHASEQPIRRQQIASLHPAFWVGSGRGGQPQREPMSVFGRAHSACCSAPLCAASSAQLPQHICSLRSAYPSLRPFLLASGPGGRDHEHGAAPEPCRLSSFTSPSQRGFRPGPTCRRGTVPRGFRLLLRQASSDTSYALGAHILRFSGAAGSSLRRNGRSPARQSMTIQAGPVEAGPVRLRQIGAPDLVLRTGARRCPGRSHRLR
jgi:hypothetical protein